MKKNYSGSLDQSKATAFRSLSSAFESSLVPATDETIDNKPSPSDFDAFIPWLCLQMQNPQAVVVKRFKQEEYNGRTSSTKKIKSSKTLRHKPSAHESSGTSKKMSVVTHRISTTYIQNIENALIINASYDTPGHLVDISITGCRATINSKVIQAIKVCLPFHPLLTKLTICKGRLNASVLYEINKMLPHSNLTDICFDDSFVPEGNYYVLLEETSQLRYLSLKRCYINNLICKQLAARLDYGRPASKTLLLLDLGSNSITDAGARALGNIFRRNRRLLYVNLSGNRITDTGVEVLMKHLQEFPLTAEEILEMKCRKIQYLKKKVAVYKTCLENISFRKKTEDIMGLPLVKRRNESQSSKKKKIDVSDMVEADNKAKAIVGDFEDIFDSQNVVQRDDRMYCIGNLVLCYINLSYTHLELPSVMKILDVLKYQNDLAKTAPATGLLKVVIEGNNIANASTELCSIDEYLRKAVTDRFYVQKNHQNSPKK